ncbi:HAD family hydrolase [Archangium lansingense]|uniref:HAD family hydrolase n=1 Tax=Archangium lansingense TaxID=2995310 RepID=A0ABT3ZU26_9BACT|nr:HAD family hydrolase [Archangium lansinium]MCY1072900.1 HAD family hydrolase [Archangium lansinium]
MIRLVVTDMDGTLYSWIDYIVPAVEALVSSVERSTDWPRIKIVQALKKVYAKYESNEYPFVLQESEIFTAFPEFGSFDKLIIEPAATAFQDARKKYLQPYPGVIETLEKLKQRGIPVVALTDAPRNPVQVRAKLLKLDQHLDAIYCLPGFEFPKSDDGEKKISRRIEQKDQQGEYRAACKVTELPRDYEKPNPLGLRRICEEMGVSPTETLVVGDALKKDVAVAREVGAVDCWAEYGTYVSLEYKERLEIISAPAITKRHAASILDGDARKNAHPTHRLSHFEQILQIIDGSSGRA